MGQSSSQVTARIVTPLAAPLTALPGCPTSGASAASEWLQGQIRHCIDEIETEAQQPAVLYERTWDPQPPTRDRGRRFVVMQFNILAEGLSSSPSAVPPCADETDSLRGSNWGGHGYVPKRDICFAWPRRRWRILEEIMRCGPDVLAIEELDHYSDFMHPALTALGYEGHWVAKPCSPCLDFGYYSDGTALFWKTEVFELVGGVVEGHYHKTDGSEMNQVYVIANLQHKGSGEMVRFVATHLKAGITKQEEATRTMQVAELLRTLTTVPQPQHIVLCGDFNSVPLGTWILQARCIPAVMSADLELHSAYPLNSLDYTLWVKKWGWDTKLVLDYIFHTAALKPTSLLQMPRCEDVEPTRLPGLCYPSDHCAIAAEFEIQEMADDMCSVMTND